MQIDLTGKQALVTGSTRGIGYAIARGLAAAGAIVHINGRTQEAVDSALSKLTSEKISGRFKSAPGDIASAQGVAAICKNLPQVDILVCNAATFDWIPFFQSTDDDWQKDIDINLMSAVRLARAYLPGMIDKNAGRVVLIASESGLNIPHDMIHYGVSKAAEIALARGLAELTAGTNVTVNSVLPGPTASSDAGDFLDKYAREKGVAAEHAERHLVESIRPSSLLRRLATVEEVANMVVYISSAQSSATNGAALRVEGGILRHPG
ncbi:SDR family oxidoreductase [Sphingobium sp. WCS2017Hpa-17]|uniref:SDR family NAD(P)-dependent oxidoreductase n=1 Tax=Sphingobium sp. WCS2017Hpa-17 TaxID=3073638 RepID=UPI00288AAC1D|nr:SDR family oxidoreductase [Sphingobium sp. WCS2017Hpa-17]